VIVAVTDAGIAGASVGDSAAWPTSPASPCSTISPMAHAD
jgi:hypothetical protein